MSSALDQAKKTLSIRSVFLRESNVVLDNELDPAELGLRTTETQSFKLIAKVNEISVESDGSQWFEYIFFYAVGVRLVDKSDSGDGEPKSLLQITATFNPRYKSVEKLDSTQIEAFSERNVGYHVWPYWREFVQSSCSRLNVPIIQIPHYFCSSEQID